MNGQTLPLDELLSAYDTSIRVDPPIGSADDLSAEVDAVELQLLAPSYPMVYVNTDDREALDAMILAGLISP